MKKPSFLLLFIGMTFASPWVQAQNPHVDRLDSAMLDQQGQMVNLKVVPGNKSLQVFLMGKKGAEINPDQTKLTARLRLSNHSSQDLRVDQKNGHYVIPAEPLNSAQATQLEITTRTGPQSESFKIDLK